jgi:hypothetical protein
MLLSVNWHVDHEPIDSIGKTILPVKPSQKGRVTLHDLSVHDNNIRLSAMLLGLCQQLFE